MRNIFNSKILLILNIIIISSNLFINSGICKTKQHTKIKKLLELKMDKTKFIPGNKVNSTVSFFIVAPQNKKWVLNITSEEYLPLIDNVTFTKNDFIKTITGMGTGKTQKIVWNGHSNNGYILPQTIYKLELKSQKQKLYSKIEIYGQEEIEVTMSRGYLEHEKTNSNQNIIEENNKIEKKLRERKE